MSWYNVLFLEAAVDTIKTSIPAISDAVRKDLEANIEMPKENVIDLDNLDTIPVKILLATFLVSPRREYVYESVLHELWKNRKISRITLTSMHECYEQEDYSSDSDDSDDSDDDGDGCDDDRDEDDVDDMTIQYQKDCLAESQYGYD
jgi:hypothetical protein